MTKLLKIFISGLLVFISINSLYAFGIGGSETITLSTNEITLSCNKLGIITGGYELFSVSNKNGFIATFTIWEDPYTFTNTMIYYHAIFSNKSTLDELESYIELFETNEKFKDNLIWQMVAMKEITDKFACDIYINNQNITQREGSPMEHTYFVMKETIFYNELVFKDGKNRTYKLKLDDKYKDIIHKKIMLYLKKKEQLQKEYDSRFQW